MTSLVLREQHGAATRILLNDAATRNSLSLDMIDELKRHISDVTTPVAIIAANGPAFSSGHNLRELTAHRNDPDSGAAFYAKLFDECSALMLQIEQHEAAIIAEVGGLASAAGCQLVASCDLAIAGDAAGFCTPGVNIGLFCSTPMVAVSRSVGRKHAMDMLLTGRVVSAAEACSMGLVNKVVPADELPGAAIALANLIAGKSAEAIRIGKKAFAAQHGLPTRDAYTAMSRVMADNLQCDDAKEGITAFIDKRKPAWTSR